MMKAIVTDLDDTLLRYDKTVSAFTIQMLQRCRSKGIKVLFASGRGMSAKNLIPLALFDGYIMMNGAVAIADGRTVYEKRIEPSLSVPFLQRMSESNLQAAAEIDGVHYANFDVSAKWRREFVIADFAAISDSAEKLYVIVDTQEQAERVRRWLPPELYPHFTKDNLALISHRDAKKSAALSAVLKAWDISLADTVAFGDDVNDIDMLEACGVGVAVENALAQVKEVADELCGTCDDDGVAKWLAMRVL